MEQEGGDLSTQQLQGQNPEAARSAPGPSQPGPATLAAAQGCWAEEGATSLHRSWVCLFLGAGALQRNNMLWLQSPSFLICKVGVNLTVMGPGPGQWYHTTCMIHTDSNSSALIATGHTHGWGWMEGSTHVPAGHPLALVSETKV